MSSLKSLLKATSILAGTATEKPNLSPTDLRAVLASRLDVYYAETSTTIHHATSEGPPNLEDVQLETALQCLHILKALQGELLRIQRDADAGLSSDPTQVGVKDIANLHRLASVVFQWGTEPLLARVANKNTFSASDYGLLSSIITQIVNALVLPPPIDGTSTEPQSTIISRDLVDRHAAHLLKPAFFLGWLPASQATKDRPVLATIRPPVMRLLSTLSPASAITALGSVLSSKPPPHVQRAVSSLLSRQLLRPGGVRGLLLAVLGDDGEDDDGVGSDELQKMEHLVKVVTAIPKGMSPEDYFLNILPGFLLILAPPKSQSARQQQQTPLVHKRAAAFVLARMLDANNDEIPGPHSAIVQDLLLPSFHSPFLHPPRPSTPTSQKMPVLTPTDALATLQTFISNAPPSLTLAGTLLSPIVPSLYLLLAAADRTKTADPTLKEALRGLVLAWVRVVGRQEAVDVLWAIVEPDLSGDGRQARLWEEYDWVVVGAEAELEKMSDIPQEGLAFLTPQDDPDEDVDPEANPYGLRPNPVHFARWLLSMERSDVASDIMVRLLNGYRELRGEGDDAALRTLLYVQIILHMQPQSTPDAPNKALPNPEHILAFVQHALEPPPLRNDQRPTNKSASLGLKDLRIVPEEKPAHLGDSDDEDSGEDDMGDNRADRGLDEEMTVTALQLLLSVLEGHPRLSARTTPVLTEIFSLLEPLTSHSAETVRSLAREARMVLTARLASTSTAGASYARTRDGEDDSAVETYQKALKLLQDPIIPVRAHGLLLLRQLVSPSRTGKQPGTSADPDRLVPKLDPALVPGVLSIFLQSAQDEDSYMFLNAVQGLSAMVDGFGKDVLKGLLQVYTRGTEGSGGSALSQHDLDEKIRVGEALAQVIRRCGEALGLYVDLLVPPLFRILRFAHLPTTLRTSALSLLAQCCDTNDLAVLPYSADLSEAMIDLVQVETVSAKPRQKPAPIALNTEDEQSKDEDDHGEEKQDPKPPKPQPTMDSHPTSSNSKFPPLRRAALHFLSLLIRACTKRAYDQGQGGESANALEGLGFPPGLVNRARTVLHYVSATDEDAIVCVMARECLEGMEGLWRAVVGM